MTHQIHKLSTPLPPLHILVYRCTLEELASILHSGFLHEKKEKVTGTWKSPTHVALHWYTHWLINHSTEPKQGREFLCFRKERKKEKVWKDGRKKEKQKRKERNEINKKGRTEMPKREKILWNVRTCAVVPSRAMWSTADDPWVSFQVAFQWQDPIF